MLKYIEKVTEVNSKLTTNKINSENAKSTTNDHESTPDIQSTIASANTNTGNVSPVETEEKHSPENLDDLRGIVDELTETIDALQQELVSVL